MIALAPADGDKLQAVAPEHDPGDLVHSMPLRLSRVSRSCECGQPAFGYIQAAVLLATS